MQQIGHSICDHPQTLLYKLYQSVKEIFEKPRPSRMAIPYQRKLSSFTGKLLARKLQLPREERRKDRGGLSNLTGGLDGTHLDNQGTTHVRG